MAWLSDSCGWLLTATAAVWTLRAGQQGQNRTSCFWRVLVAAAVVAFRWPRLLAPYEFSPDESQSLAGALTLLHDPRFWISVDGATAGPLHFFAQIPAALFPSGAIYFVSRLEAIALVLGTFFSVGAILKTAVKPVIEQLAVLPAAIAFAVSRTPDLQHFSTEVVPCFLVTTALALSFDARTEKGSSRLPLAAIGLCLGAMPLAKLQAAPVALLAGLFISRRTIRTAGWRSVTVLVGAALVPTFLTALYLTATDAWQQALVPYLFNNVSYVETAPLSIGGAARGLLESIGNDGYVAGWMITGLMLVAIAALVGRKRSSSAFNLNRIAGAWLLIAVVCVMIPSRPYLHYIHLLLAPELLLVGVALGTLDDLTTAKSAAFRRAGSIGLLLLGLLPLAVLQRADWNRYAWLTAYFAHWGRENRTMAKMLEKYQKPDDSLAIWGSRSDLYVKTHLWQAIPQAHSQTQISPGPWQTYFLREYVANFQRHRPAFFIDAVGPTNFLFENRAEAYEAFPPLRTIVHEQYTQIAELGGTRLFVRNDRLGTKTPASSTVTQP